MKKFHVFTLLFLLVNSNTFACGYYPYGEDIRFSLLVPTKVFPGNENKFYYTSNLFYGEFEFSGESAEFYDENISLWYNYLNQKVDKSVIYEAVYHSSVTDLKNRASSNTMIQLLQLKENRAIRNYLLFAIQCSDFNAVFNDPWERNPKDSKKKRAKMIKKAIKLAAKSEDEQLKKRYAHLAIRLAFYSDDKQSVLSIYDQYFNNTTTQNAIDLWALHFKIQHSESNATRNIEVARVFAYSKEKRYAIHKFYNKELDFDYVLSQAKTDEDRAALAYIQGTLTLDRSVKYIQLFNTYSNKKDLLSELTLREINKLEDWVLTPYYSEFEPSTPMNWDYDSDAKQTRERMMKDRAYATEFSNWMKSVKCDHLWWKSMQMYCQFIGHEFDGLSEKIESELKFVASNTFQETFLNQLFALTKTASKEDFTLNHGRIQNALMDAEKHSNNLFKFAMARELEFAGNTSDGACLLAHVNKNNVWDESSYWKSKQRHHSLNTDVYYEYFTYLDVAYSIEEMNELIINLNTRNRRTPFRSWLESEISKEYTRLYDLVGTKYFRKNQLEKALEAFKKVDDTLWTSDSYYYKDYLNEDPFINNFYSRGVQPQYDSKRSYTKPELVQKMIDLRHTIETESGTKKAMAAYLLANGYRNTSQYGNSWMMRRYYWSSTGFETGIEDDDEYLECNLAKKYYLIASKESRSSKFAVLALRMAGKCESYKLYREVDSYYLSSEEYAELFHANAFYKEIKKNYPEDYDLVVSNCDALQGYFEAGMN